MFRLFFGNPMAGEIAESCREIRNSLIHVGFEEQAVHD
jgi:hypothetical protein